MPSRAASDQMSTGRRSGGPPLSGWRRAMSLTEVRPTTADESPAPTRDELLERVRAIGPLVREQARAGDARRGLTDEVVEAIKSAGLFRILQPRRWGGMELDLATFYLVQLELSKYDMSAGWVHGVVGVHAWQAGIFDDRAARDIWGADPSVLIASSYMPAAKL